MTMQPRRETILNRLYHIKAHHILLWVIYFIFWISIYKDYYPSFLDLLSVIFAYFIFNAASFYVTAYYLFPRFLYKNRYGLFFLSFGVVVILFSLGLTGVLYLLFKDVAGFQNNILAIFQIALSSIVTMVGVLSAGKLIIEKIRSDRTARILDKQRIESELQYLRAQVNPHFLFNAINSVYFLIKKNPTQAAETLIKLSDLLRFQLYDCTSEKIAIEKEIEYLDNFVALEKIRKGDKIKIQVNHQGDLSGFYIAPFLLIPFFENAFKYVSNSSDQQNLISIEMKRDGNLFSVVVTNTTDDRIKNEVGGIGLRNVKRRLELLYAGKHRLDIRDEACFYSVHLSLIIA